MPPVHPLENPVAPRLQGKVQTMLNVPQFHEPSHFVWREVGWMRAQEPEPEAAVQVIDRGQDVNKPSDARPIPVDVLSQEEQFGEPAGDGLFRSTQNLSDVDNDLGASCSWNNAVGAVAFASTNKFNVSSRKQRLWSLAVQSTQRHNGPYDGQHLLHIRGALHDLETAACNANGSFSVECGSAAHEYDVVRSDQRCRFAQEAEGLLLGLLADSAGVDDDQ
jgi:hypothetical protein